MIGNAGFGEVKIQDTTQPLFNYYLQVEEKTDITLTAPAAIDDQIVSVSAGHGFVAGPDQLITIVEGDLFIQGSVLLVNVNDITLSIPLGKAFTTAAKVIRGNKNLKQIGSVGAPIESAFRFHDVLNATVPIDISKIKITLTHAVAGDAGKFGGIAQLTNGGFYLRRENDDRINLGNFINNQAFEDFGGEVVYSAKGPAGINATIITFDVKQIYGQVIRMHPKHDDKFLGYNRNDLSALTTFYISLIGSLTEGEQ